VTCPHPAKGDIRAPEREAGFEIVLKKSLVIIGES
jgi:hypothetical protein